MLWPYEESTKQNLRCKLKTKHFQGEHTIMNNYSKPSTQILQSQDRVCSESTRCNINPHNYPTEELASLFVTLKISKNLDNGENQSLDDLLNFMDTKLGALHGVSLINFPTTSSSQVGTIIRLCLSSITFQCCQTLRSWPILHQHYIEPLNYLYRKTYSSSFRIAIEGPLLLLPNNTSLPDKKESCLTRFTRLHYSQTNTTDSLKIG